MSRRDRSPLLPGPYGFQNMETRHAIHLVRQQRGRATTQERGITKKTVEPFHNVGNFGTPKIRIKDGDE